MAATMTTRRTNNVNDVDASDGDKHDDDNGVGCGGLDFNVERMC